MLLEIGDGITSEPEAFELVVWDAESELFDFRPKKPSAIERCRERMTYKSLKIPTRSPLTTLYHIVVDVIDGGFRDAVVGTRGGMKSVSSISDSDSVLFISPDALASSAMTMSSACMNGRARGRAARMRFTNNET